MATATAKRTHVQRREFINCTQGYLGVVKINRKGDEHAEPVAPGMRVFLTDEEIELTAQQHQRKEDSPFEVREIVHRNLLTGDPVETYMLCPLEPAATFSRSGGVVLPPALQPQP